MRQAAMGRMAVLGLLAVAGVCSAAQEGRGHWQALNAPGGKVAVDSGGRLWILTPDGLLYWDGQQLAAPRLSELKRTYSPDYTRICGNPAAGAYLLVPGEGTNQGRAYRLLDGEVRLATDFYVESFGANAGFYPSRSGVYVNYGRRFVAARLPGGEWHRIEARSVIQPVIVEAARHVVIITYGWLYDVDEQGRIEEVPAPELAADGMGYPVQIRADPRPDGTVGLTGMGPSWSYALYDPKQRTLRPSPQPGPAKWMAGARFLSADGSEVFPQVMPSQLLPSETLPPWWNQGARLAASNGDLWSSFPDGTVTRFRDGELTVYDWHDGLLGSPTTGLLEGAGGQVFACSWREIYVFRPGQPLPASSVIRLWEERRLAPSSAVLADSEGRLWMLPAESQGELSVWDGRRWGQVEVGLDPAHSQLALADDRGHVIVQSTGYRQDRTHPAFDVTVGGATRYDDVGALLLAAVRDGARRFTAPAGSSSCYVLEDGRIWYGTSYYDGSEWSGMSPDYSGQTVLLESARYGVVFADVDAFRYWYYDRGQFASIPTPGGAASFLLGPLGYQPFEAALMEEHPGRYVPVLKVGEREFRLLRQAPADPGQVPPPSDVGDLVPQYTGGAVEPMPPVHYLLKHAGVHLGWSVQGSAFEADFTGTPLEGRNSFIRQVVAGPAGGLWFIFSDRGVTSAFGRRMDGFRVTAGPAPQRVSGSLPLDVRLEGPGLDPARCYVFWRVNDGPYQGGGGPGRITVSLDHAGRNTVEVIGVDPMGAVTPQPLKLSLSVSALAPEMEVAVEGPYTVRDVVWRAPVKAVSAAPGMPGSVAYRIDGGEWRTAERGLVRTGGLEPGPHTAEFAAGQAGGVPDTSPVRVEFEYKPDYEMIVESRMDALSGADPEAARRALEEIRSAGPDVLPVLERKLDEARRAARQAEELRRALEEVGR